MFHAALRRGNAFSRDTVTPKYAESAQQCKEPSCSKLTFWFCAGCHKADVANGGGPGSGFYCVHKSRNCFEAGHRRRARTKVEATEEGEEECDACEED